MKEAYGFCEKLGKYMYFYDLLCSDFKAEDSLGRVDCKNCGYFIEYRRPWKGTFSPIEGEDLEVDIDITIEVSVKKKGR